MRKLIKCSLRENLLSLSLLLGDKNFDEDSRVEAHQIVEECLAMTRTEKAAVEVKALRAELAVELRHRCVQKCQPHIYFNPIAGQCRKCKTGRRIVELEETTGV